MYNMTLIHYQHWIKELHHILMKLMIFKFDLTPNDLFINLNNDIRTFLNQKCPIIGCYQDTVSSKSCDINMAATMKGVHPYVE